MKKNHKLINRILFLVFILVFVLIILIGIDFGFLNYFKDFFKEPELIVIEDNCGVVVGNLIHEIKSEENCKIRCLNECRIIDKSFFEIEFLKKENSCYECNCYCN